MCLNKLFHLPISKQFLLYDGVPIMDGILKGGTEYILVVVGVLNYLVGLGVVQSHLLIGGALALVCSKDQV